MARILVHAVCNAPLGLCESIELVGQGVVLVRLYALKPCFRGTVNHPLRTYTYMQPARRQSVCMYALASTDTGLGDNHATLCKFSQSTILRGCVMDVQSVCRSPCA